MNSIFISYSHEDGKWKNLIEKHLKTIVLEEPEKLKVWTDTEIDGGDEWLPKIESALNTSTVAVLVITANFLTSPFILKKEVETLLDLRKQLGITVIPVIAESCAWRQIKWLAALQCRPKGGKALDSFEVHEMNNQLVELVEEILMLSEKKHTRAQPTANPIAIEGCQAPITFGRTLGDRIAMATDSGDWYWINANKSTSSSLGPLPPLSACMSNGADELMAAFYDRKIGYLKNAEWQFLTMPNPVLALAKDERSVIAGDVAGMICRIIDNDPQYLPLSIQEPIMQLLHVGHFGLVVLGTSGRLWKVDEENTRLLELRPNTKEPVRQILSAALPLQIVLITDRQVTMFDLSTGTIKASIQPLPLNSTDVLRKAVATENNLAYGVITDGHSFFLVGGDLQKNRIIEFSHDNVEIADVNPGANGGFLVWTTDGTLYQVEGNGAFRKKPFEQVSYAHTAFAVWKNAERYYAGSLSTPAAHERH
jgi:hypothetical protein